MYQICTKKTEDVLSIAAVTVERSVIGNKERLVKGVDYSTITYSEGKHSGITMSP